MLQVIIRNFLLYNQIELKLLYLNYKKKTVLLMYKN